jgi:hypothetical protein
MKALPPGDPAVFGDLARRLHEDVDGKVLADYRQSFETLLFSARKKLHEPLSAEGFETSTAMAESAQLSLEVISSVWDSLHA